MLSDFDRRRDEMHRGFRRSALTMFVGWMLSVLVLGGVTLGVLCGLIYFVFWCLERFGVLT